MMLNVVFRNEMRDIGGGIDGSGTTAVDGAVDEEFDVVFERGVDESFTLTFFGGGVLAISHGDLDTLCQL